jgi:hypothetical protein
MVARGHSSKSSETGVDFMFTSLISRRQADRPAARRPRTRRPLVEDLEGRLLLSGIQGNHIGTSVDLAIVGNHIGTSISAAMIQGNHIGMSASGSARGVSSANTYTVRFFG